MDGGRNGSVRDWTGRGKKNIARRGKLYILPVRKIAEVVELVDTLCSGRSVLTGVGVQIPPSAENMEALS